MLNGCELFIRTKAWLFERNQKQLLADNKNHLNGLKWVEKRILTDVDDDDNEREKAKKKLQWDAKGSFFVCEMIEKRFMDEWIDGKYD